MSANDPRDPPFHAGRDAGSAEMGMLVGALLFPTVAAWLYFLVLPEGAGLIVAYFVAKLLQFALPLAWTAWVRREGLRALAPGRAGLGRGLVSGALLAAAVLLAYAAVLRGTDVARAVAPRIRARVEMFSADTLAGFLVLAFGLAVVHSFLEEYYWRWFVYSHLRRRFGLGRGIVVGSLGFMGHHLVVLAAFTGATGITLGLGGAVALVGALWAWQYERSGTLTGPWVSHVLVDLAILAVGWDLIGGS